MMYCSRNIGLGFVLCASFALGVLIGIPPRAHAEDFDSVMYSHPVIPVSRVVKTFPEGLKELWMKALDRPERDQRSRAALAIAEAHEGGMPGLASTASALVRLLDRPDEHPAVLAAAIRALVVIDARSAAPAFLELARSNDTGLREVIEPALARWDYKPARDVWLSRLGQEPPYRPDLILAIRCLGRVREDHAAQRLRELALESDVAPPVRLAAARALAEIRTRGSEADSVKLTGDTTMRGRTNRLVGATLLRRHEGPEAIRLLQAFAKDAEPTVALVAVTRLSELNLKHILPVLKEVMANEGAEVRSRGIAAMIQNPSDEHLRSLARTLSDPHPDVRVQARRGLHELAGDRRPLVIELSMSALNRTEWRGQEQAAILVAQLDHKPAAKRLVELLKSNRSEVAVAVGWGLRQLAVPETLPAVLDHVKSRHAALLRSGPGAGLRGVTPEALDRQLAQLVQFLGQTRFAPAEPALRALVPRILRGGMPPEFTPVPPETRAAAIWAMGLLHEGKPTDALVTLIETRLTGDGMFGRDDPRVRRMAAVTLARLNAKQSIGALREYSDGTKPTIDIVANACRWSVAQLTQQPVPAVGIVEAPQRQWFLVPIE